MFEVIVTEKLWGQRRFDQKSGETKVLARLISAEALMQHPLCLLFFKSCFLQVIVYCCALPFTGPRNHLLISIRNSYSRLLQSKLMLVFRSRGGGLYWISILSN
jgi:hypothetical protein